MTSLSAVVAHRYRWHGAASLLCVPGMDGNLPCFDAPSTDFCTLF